MKRKILIGLLATGTVLGFGGGAFSLAHRSGQGCGHHDERARELARVCVDAALAARDGDGSAALDASGEADHGWGRERMVHHARRLCAAEGARRRP
jgi:hypothetical protein